MIQRGRKSSASLALVGSEGKTSMMIAPPEHLTDDQGIIWRVVMASAISSIIRPEAYPVLEEYCRTSVNAKRIAGLIENLDSESTIEEFDKLLAMQARTQRVLIALAEKLRLVPSAVKHGEIKAAKVLRTSNDKPIWEDHD